MINSSKVLSVNFAHFYLIHFFIERSLKLNHEKEKKTKTPMDMV